MNQKELDKSAIKTNFMQKETINEKIMQLSKASVLDITLGLQVSVFANRELEVISGLLGQEKSKQKLVIADLGCGSGAFTSKIASRFELADIVGLDNNIHLLDASSSSSHERIRFVNCDIEQGNMPSFIEKADVIVLRYTLQHLRDYCSLLRRVYEKMRVGSVLFALEAVHAENKENVEGGLFNQCIAALMRLYNEVGSDYQISERLVTDMQRIGFRDVEQRKIIHDFQNSNEDQLIRLIISYAVLINKFNPDILSEDFVGQLEEYVRKHVNGTIHFITSVTYGVK